MSNDEILLKSNKAKKMMLWLGMISMSMTFAGLTSAYVVSSSRADWIQQIDLPFDFTISDFCVLSTLGMWLAVPIEIFLALFAFSLILYKLSYLVMTSI